MSVVTSSAGYPLDTTFYQSVKGLTGALPIVKQGGTIVMAASLSQGIGSPEFQSLFRDNLNLEGSSIGFWAKNISSWTNGSWKSSLKVRRKAKVKIVSDGIPAEELNKLFVESAPSVEKAVEDCLAEYGSDASIAVIPKGPLRPRSGCVTAAPASTYQSVSTTHRYLGSLFEIFTDGACVFPQQRGRDPVFYDFSGLL